MKLAHRLQYLQSNLFRDMDQAKHVARQLGHNLIDLSVGSSDLSPPPEALATIEAALQDRVTHGYALFHSTREFREACAVWYEQRFGVAVDPETELMVLLGSQEGTAYLPLALLDPGEVALITDPCYPSHFGGVHLAGGVIERLPLRAEHQFLPVLDQISSDLRERARLMVLSYPNNPTTATAPLEFWQQAVQFCQDHDIVLIHDFPYANWVFEGDPAISIFQVDPSKRVGIELFSMSKAFHMGGFRVGYAIGHPDLIRALEQIKTAVNFNQYLGILRGATAALKAWDPFVKDSLEIYRQRRNVCVKALHQIGWEVNIPSATMYIWTPIPSQYQGSSSQFCVDLVKATGVALAPGSGFGPGGEDYVRFALVVDNELLQKAVDRIAQFIAR